VLDDLLEVLRLADPIAELALARDAPDDARARGDDFLDRRREVGRVAMRQLRRGIDTGGLEQVGVLGPDALDPHQVDVVDPFEDERMRDPRRRLE
jgi:hypothetical protein